MNKLSFSELLIMTTLSHNEMKNVRAGEGTCGYKGPDRDGKPTIICGISKSEAVDFWVGDQTDAHWCCDSCAGNGGSASYC